MSIQTCTEDINRFFDISNELSKYNVICGFPGSGNVNYGVLCGIFTFKVNLWQKSSHVCL